MIIDKLWIVCNQLEDVENEVYSLTDQLEEKDYSDVEIGSIMTSLDIVIASVADLIEALKKEELLRSQNETLCALYAEYTTIRDLIGSEK